MIGRKCASCTCWAQDDFWERSWRIGTNISREPASVGIAGWSGTCCLFNLSTHDFDFCVYFKREPWYQKLLRLWR